MFKKILIANRGEIACRVIKSAQNMGIKTVAVYSDADKESRHVLMADEAYYLGASPALESYLVIDKIIAACIETKADAVHPGYGFVSENTEFAEQLAAHNIEFIGPPVKAIAAMGDKIASKNLAIKAGVNCIKGYNDEVHDDDQVLAICHDIGYPVMLKASAGGGGKGMRLAYNDEEALAGFRNARSEAMKSFGDDRIFIEQFIEHPRHIEIQILGDKFGNIIYLGERECSLQRRHQKVIEEAPSSFLTPEVRKNMGEQAIMLAQEVGYYSAGTVEFIMDKNKNFYFLEMNTRLQVEHPVTEYIFNVDLVEWMIHIAAGNRLTLQQEDMVITGHAIESRIYAEDSRRGFLPSTGRIRTYRTPEYLSNTRVDTGVIEGADISIFYDPMIAKLITYGKNRDEAIELMRHALNAYVIDGVEDNIDFLSQLITSEFFQQGATTTNIIGDLYPDGLEAHHMVATGEFYSILVMMQAFVTQYIYGLFGTHNWTIFDQYLPEDIKNYKATNVTMDITPTHCNAVIEDNEGGVHTFKATYEWALHAPCLTLKINDTTYIARVKRHHNHKHTIYADGKELCAMVVEQRHRHHYSHMRIKDGAAKQSELVAPMPGVIVAMHVKPGDEVKKGMALCVIEAMKMENILYADHQATIDEVFVNTGEQIAVDALICSFKFAS